MAGVRFTLDGRDQALDQLGRAADQLANPRPLWEEVGASLVASTQRRFETGVGPDGSPWPPSIRALAVGGKTLVDTARLMQSITFNASESGVEVGTNVLYAAIHQFGGTINAKTPAGLRFQVHGASGKKEWRNKQSVKIPARPFIGLDDRDETEISTIAAAWLARAAGGAGASP
jgi:phage virion morphogenesis protein